MTITDVQPAKARSESRQRPVVASARLTGTEWDQLRDRAEQEGQSVSGYLRDLIQRALRTA